MASVRDSLDFDAEDLENNLGAPGAKQSDHPPAYDAPRGNNFQRDISPLPAPIPRKPSASLPRESLDGETMFAVGDEDDKSDDDDYGNGESSRLAGKHD